MESFTENAIKIIGGIPFGRAMSYKAVATLAGNPRSARTVARILHSMTAKYGLPWHRVVDSRGRIAFRDAAAAEEQRRLLEAEGVRLKADGSIEEEFLLR